MNKKPEVVITFADIFWGVVRRWRLLLALTLICAVAFGAYSYFKEETGVSAETVRLSNLSGLSAEKAQTIQDVVEIKNLYANMLADYDGDYITKIDENKILVTTLSYYVDAKVSDDYDFTTDLLNAYATLGIGAELRETFLAGQEANLVREEDLGYLLSADASGRTLTFTIRTGADDASKSLADSLAKLIRQTVETNSKELKSSIGTHTIKEVASTATVGPDAVITEAKYVKKTAVETAKQDASDAYEHLNADEQARVDAILTVNDAKDGLNSHRSVSKKKVLLGAIFGFVLAALLSLGNYIWTKKLVNIAELEQSYGLHVFGKLQKPVRGSVFHKLDGAIARKQYRVNTKESYEEQLANALARLELRAQVAETDRLVIAGSQPIAADILDGALAKLPNAKSAFEDGKFSMEALLSAHDGGSVVLVEQMGVSKRGIVEDLLKICDEQKITVLGIITLI